MDVLQVWGYGPIARQQFQMIEPASKNKKSQHRSNLDNLQLVLYEEHDPGLKN